MTRTFSRLVPAVLAACALALPLTLAACGAAPADTSTEAAQTKEATTDTDAAADDASATTEESPMDAEHTSPVPEAETEESYRAKWETKACSFLTVYPVNYVRTSADDEPIEMTLEDWASNCLSYLDPTCQLAQDLQNDPESIATPLGYYEAAQVVNDTKVVSTDDTSVTVEVTVEGTQQDWDHTLTMAYTFRVFFGDKALITGVEDLR